MHGAMEEHMLKCKVMHAWCDEEHEEVQGKACEDAT